MNKISISKQLNGGLAFALSGSFHIILVTLVSIWIKDRLLEPLAFHPAPMRLSVAQIELQAAAPPLEAEPIHEEIHPEPSLREKVDAPLEPISEEPKPEPQPIREATAQVTQEASAPTASSVERNILLHWVREQIEKEKYYPPAARNAGYEGQFRLWINVGADGKISEATVLDGQGHYLLRQSLEKIIVRLIGRDFGQTLPDPVALPFEFEFKLN